MTELLLRARVRGAIPEVWSAWFDDLQATPEPASETTTLTGRFIDQAAVHGVLRRLSDLGLDLVDVEVHPAESDDPPTAASTPHRRDAGSGKE